jgi:predicted component of type VI protein secretion system
MDVRLVVNPGKGKTREIPLPGTVFLIGRGAKCHLRPHCRLVSKLHCAIASWAGKVAVRDLNSANGTFINKEMVRGEVRINDGDVLQVGSLTFTFRISLKTDDALPVPIVRETDLSWLMESPADSAVLSPDQTTKIKIPADLFPDTFGDPAAASGLADDEPAAARGKPLVSAGDYLREYFRQRKGRPLQQKPKKDANPSR